MEPGDNSFYEWITSRRGYYPEQRWEWSHVTEHLAAEQSQLSVLEVGCGDGRFLEMLARLPNTRVTGLDTTPASVEKCRARKLDVHCETLADHQRRLPEDSRPYDVVIAFHCLEHVADPSGLVSGMLALLASGGRLLISTPFSPMSFESLWFDPLNHPPHHMSRWNLRSYEALARRHGLSVSFRMPQADGVRRRVANAFNFRLNGPRHFQSARRIFCRAMLRPHLLLAEIWRQWRRPRVNGNPAADVVLAEFRRDAS